MSGLNDEKQIPQKQIADSDATYAQAKFWEIMSKSKEIVGPLPSEIIYVDVNSSDEFKTVGIRDGSFHDSELKEGEFTISKEKVQVKFFKVDVLDVGDQSEDHMPLFPKPSTNINLTRSFTHIKEKPTSTDAVIVPVTPNIIKVSSNHNVKVVKSDVDATDNWEIQEGYHIFKLLRPVHYSPSKGVRITESQGSLDRKQSDLKNSSSDGNKECHDFLSPLSAANLIVTNTVHQATERYRKLITNYGDPERWHIRSNLKVPSLDSRWPSIKEFTIEKGLCYIENYIIETNEFRENWKYAIYFNGAQSDKVSDHYFYEGKFSLPSTLYPIAQVSASLFFYVEVSRVIPSQCPIKVSFRIESSRYKIDPEHYILKDNALLMILDFKLRIIVPITF